MVDRESERFIDLLHPALPDGGRVLIWTLADKRSAFFADAAAAADYAASRAESSDVYVGCGIQPDGLGTGHRATPEQVIGIGAVWCDVDAGKPGSKKTYPPTIEDAVTLVRGIGVEPSLIVDTGGGIHAWWLLDEPWLFADAVDRKRAADLCRGWVTTVQVFARVRGWSVDSVGDLSRIMRLPGTFNRKFSPPRPVRIIHERPLRYSPEHLSDYLTAEEYSTPDAMIQVGAVTLRAGAAAPHADRLAQADAIFRRTWERKRVDMRDQSASSYDLAVANEGVLRGWTDQEIADAIVAWRTTHGAAPDKALRRDYVVRTIGMAKKAHEQTAALNDAQRDPAPVGDDGRAVGLDRLSKIFGLRVSRVVLHEGEAGIHSLYLADPDRVVRIGTVDAMITPKRLRAALLAEGIVLDVPSKRWNHMLRVLVAIRETEANPEGSLQARVDGWVADYLRRYPPTERSADVIMGGKPVIEDGVIHVSATDMRRWLDIAQSTRITQSQLCADLRDSGWKPRFLKERDKNGRQTAGRYWVKSQEAMEISDSVGNAGIAW